MTTLGHPGDLDSSRADAAVGLDGLGPSPARVYDYLLGGSHSFEADRVLARKILAADPNAGRYAQANRAFLHRVVRRCVAAGITQFLDLGAGLPTVGPVHEIAQAANTDARVVYVDIDPVAVAHAHAHHLLDTNSTGAAVEADLRDPDQVLAQAVATGLLDLRQPVAVLLVAVLHFIPDTDHPARIIATYRDAVAAGSRLALSHATPPSAESSPAAETIRRAYRDANVTLTLRGPGEIGQLLGGWRLLDPGIVPIDQWRPDQPPTGTADIEVPGLAAVAVKPIHYTPTPAAGRPSRPWHPTRQQLAALWQQPHGLAAVRTRDVATIYRLLQHYGVSQREIARLVGHTSQSEISEILAGRRVRNIDVLSRIADALALPRVEFGLAPNPSTPDPPDDPETPPPLLCTRCAEPVPTTPEPPISTVPVVRFANGSLAPAYWTGVESRMLRVCRRMNVRAFAAHLGISDRMISKWEAAGAAIRPRPTSQAILDTALRAATPDERARFTSWLQQARSAARSSAPACQCPVGEPTEHSGAQR